MALVLPNNMAEHSEAGSNSYNGPGSTEYPIDGTIEALVNWLRAALAPESPLWLKERALRGLDGEFGSRSRIRRIAEAYGRESYCRAVYECLKRVHHDLDDWDRYLKLVMLLPTEDYLAVFVRGTLERNMLERATDIFSGCTPSEIQVFKDRYHSILGVQLEDDIRRFTDGYHREVLLAHLGIQTPAARHGDIDVEMVDLERVTKILVSLHQAFEQITYRSPQKNIMNNILGQDKEYLSAVMCSYPEYYGRSLEMDLMHEQHGHFEQAILAMMKCSVNRPKYFAEVLHEAMRDPNGQAMRDTSQIDRDTIVSVITTMAQEDMNTMKAEYLLEYGSTVEGDIALAFSDRQDCMEVLSLLLNSDASN